ncbi:nuclear transport factor 2 family protein [Pseudomonas sp. St316]|uniref:nuclear transport factor 2 family protein n=1 Tax=Pseudomonas sp. St316 TaxID=2678257 RepID=UPI001BB36264|nr:nuclear transport factor 2 family protein [Pseudomonas sp. St316]BBP58337.1 hypothetical protein PHLH4_19270 [Pseudomonas sp. St316]
MTARMSLASRLQTVALYWALSASPVWALDTVTQDANVHRVHQAFTNWQQGKGTAFDLLAPNPVWTVTGSSPVSSVYNSKEDLLEQAVRPITARLATAVSPTVQSIIAEDDVVVVLWSGKATALDRKPYDNT